MRVDFRAEVVIGNVPRRGMMYLARYAYNSSPDVNW
jgi:hypothetical protein